MHHSFPMIEMPAAEDSGQPGNRVVPQPHSFVWARPGHDRRTRCPGTRWERFRVGQSGPDGKPGGFPFPLDQKARRNGSGDFPVTRRPSSNRHAGFTMVELLTVMAIVAILATLLASSLASARSRSRTLACQNQLRQVAIAIEIYQDDTGRRPRTFTRLTGRPTWLSTPRVLLCPSDPALRSGTDGSPADVAWGNLASPTQEPPARGQMLPEEGSWEAEIAMTTESLAYSYLHPLAWRRDAWQKLAAQGNQVGLAVCQLHGVRVPQSDPRLYLAYEGSTLRAQRDGAVVLRKIFRTADTSPPPPVYSGSGHVRPNPTVTLGNRGPDYPWEFYTDESTAL